MTRRGRAPFHDPQRSGFGVLGPIDDDDDDDDDDDNDDEENNEEEEEEEVEGGGGAGAGEDGHDDGGGDDRDDDEDEETRSVGMERLKRRPGVDFAVLAPTAFGYDDSEMTAPDIPASEGKVLIDVISGKILGAKSERSALIEVA